MAETRRRARPPRPAAACSPASARGHLGLVALLAGAARALRRSCVPNFLSLGTLNSFMYQLPLLGLLSLAMVVPLLTGGLNLAIIATTNQCALLMVFVMRSLITARDRRAGRPSASSRWRSAAGLAALPRHRPR